MSVWDALVGQAPAARVLADAAVSARAGGRGATHAWLLTGPPGSGRSVAGRAFAAALLCRTDPPGCGTCPDCRQATAGSHPDVRVVATEATSLGVKELRRVVRDAALAPVSGRFRVVIVEDADRLTEQAANALLKTLEEPPGPAVFLLCAPSTEDLPPTVRSRCRVVTLRQPPREDVARVLTREGVDEAMALWAAGAAQGHVGRARRLATDEEARGSRLDALRLPSRLSSLSEALGAAADLVAAAKDEAQRVAAALDETETANLREALGVTGSRRPRGAAGALRELADSQGKRARRVRTDAVDRALVDLTALYRDVLARQLGASVDPVHPDQAPVVARIADTSTPEQTLRRIDAVLACRESVAASGDVTLAVEAMALQLAAPGPRGEA